MKPVSTKAWHISPGHLIGTLCVPPGPEEGVGAPATLNTCSMSISGHTPTTGDPVAHISNTPALASVPGRKGLMGCSHLAAESCGLRCRVARRESSILHCNLASPEPLAMFFRREACPVKDIPGGIRKAPLVVGSEPLSEPPPTGAHSPQALLPHHMNPLN